MKVPVLSIRDSLVGFGSPFTAVNEDVAIRGFANSIRRCLESDVDDPVSPEDLSLYRIGEFDTVDGVISSCEPYAIARGHSIVTEYHARSCNCVDCSGGDSVDVKEA